MKMRIKKILFLMAAVSVTTAASAGAQQSSVSDMQIAEFKAVGYLGETLDGKPHGRGRENKANGEYYIGSWNNGQRHGRGMLQTEKGNTYLGLWENGKRNGEGIFQWADGSAFRGQWRDDEMHGRGKYFYADGRSLSGTWEHGKKNGMFVFMEKDGRYVSISYLADLQVWLYDQNSPVFNYNADVNADGYISDEEMDQHRKRREVWMMRQQDAQMAQQQAQHQQDTARVQAQSEKNELLDTLNTGRQIMELYKLVR